MSLIDGQRCHGSEQMSWGRIKLYGHCVLPPEIGTKIDAGVGARIRVSRWNAPLSIALRALERCEPVIVVENGRRRKIPKRQAIVTQLVNRSAKADLKAIQILLMMLRDIESRADPGSADPAAFTEADQQIIKRIRARLRGEKDKP